MLREDHPGAAKHRLVEVLEAWAPPLFQALSAPEQTKVRLQLRSVPEEFRSPELDAAFE